MYLLFFCLILKIKLKESQLFKKGQPTCGRSIPTGIPLTHRSLKSLSRKNSEDSFEKKGVVEKYLLISVSPFFQVGIFD